MTSEPMCPPVATKRKLRGYWQNIDNVLKEVEIWRSKNGGVFPNQKSLGKTGNSSLGYAVISHFKGFRALRELLGEKQKRLPNKHWENFECVRDAIVEWQRTHDGEFPTKPALDLAGMSALGVAISRHHDGFNAVRQRLQQPQVRLPDGHWKDFENVRRVMEQYRIVHGKLPSGNDLENAGYSSVSDAISKYHDGVEAVRSRLGEQALQQTAGYWKDFENVLVVIAKYKNDYEKFPTHADLQRIGKSSVSMAITKYHGGFANVAQKMGEPNVHKILPKGYWQNIKNVYEALELWVSEHHGKFPTQRELKSNRLSSISAACNDHHGGFPAVRKKMGFDPISDESLVTHANDLAQIVIELGVPTDPFWSAMKGRWIERDLTAAIAEFKETGSLERFRTLLDGDRSS